MAIVGRSTATPAPGYHYDPSAVSMGNIYGQVKTPKPAPDQYGGYINREQQDLARYNEQERRRRERMQYDAQFAQMNGGAAGGGATSARATATASGRPAPGSDDWNQRLSSIQSLISQYAPQSGRVSRTAGPSAEQEKASRDAAFARAKETAGMNALASMKALDDVVAGNGQMGSTMAAAKQGQIIGGAGSEINEFLRDQAMTEADNATHIADMEYQGQVSQRNAEHARQQAIMSLLMGALY